MLPALALVVVFVLIPAALAIYIGFTNQTLLGPNAKNVSSAGLENYLRLLSDDQFWNSPRISFLSVFGSAFTARS